MENLHIITIKYLSATNTRGSRVKLTSNRFKESKTLGFDYSLNNIEDMAIKYLENKGFIIIGKDEDFVVSSTFKSIK